MTWNPQIYLAYASERTRPAAELLARVPDENPGRVADLGCGPGNSTALLAARWPKAQVDGVDSSPDMLKEAQAAGIPANWIEADVQSWSPDAPYDVIYSNATYQWLGDHERLLPRLMSYVNKGGTFAFQVPRNFADPSHVLMHDVANNGPWKAKLADVRPASVLSPERYYDILSPLSASLDIWETIYLQVMEGDDPVYRWVSATGLRPFAQALAGEEREQYLAEYRRRLRQAYPRRADGKTLFPFRRLFAVARR